MDCPPQASPGAAGAIVLFAHGARDPRWALPLARLKSELAWRCPGLRVEIAFLEMQPPGLPQTLEALAGAGERTIRIAPVFWSLGGHVARDLPIMIEAFRAAHPQVTIEVGAVLAELPGMDAFLAQSLLEWAAAPSPQGP
jgi:sirohydrochlorin cobaltochelatase